MIDNADQAFKLFDADGDGKINGEELKALVDKVGQNVRMKMIMMILKMKMTMVMMKMKMIMVVMKMKMVMVRMIDENEKENDDICYKLL